MKIKYVCHGLISLYVNFLNNRTMWSTNLHKKFAGGGEKEKEPKSVLKQFFGHFGIENDVRTRHVTKLEIQFEIYLKACFPANNLIFSCSEN